MGAITEKQIGQKEPQLRQSLFEMIIKDYDVATEWGDEEVYITAEKFCWLVAFDASKNNGYAMKVQKFGRWTNDGFIKYEPTKEQLRTMREIIAKELEALEERLEEERQEEEWRKQEVRDWQETMDSLYRTER